ncbi:RHS repeat-associated core domain-containing protein [Candidatus Amarolinea aalborgensis]|uniref:RHS repeat-associated core domain-containing protein n=1 Tax=Candidatus Amarolinea aalborgensis TaxID=2249329 RepID=UPI003BFA07E8
MQPADLSGSTETSASGSTEISASSVEPLAEVGAATASFAYDADGNRIKSVLNGETITYVGSLYEKKVVGSATTHTKYYTFGGRRIAVRVAGILSWLLSDHLGSTTVTADGVSGVRTAELWYKPWGESRGTPFGATPTTYRFTGQREDASIGLYFYNARYYDPTLGRFISADTIVPQPGNPAAPNRYAYTANNPVKYNDPTGHRFECGVQGGECSNDTYYTGFSVLDRRPWVQAYLADQMDGRHFGEIILAGILGNAIGNFVGQAVGDLFCIGAPQVQVGAGQSSFRASDAVGDPGFGPTALPSTARLLPSNEVRQWYSDQAGKIDTSGPPTRELAEQVHAQRNALKVQARSMMVDQAAASQLDKDFPIRDFTYYVNKYSAQGYTGTELWKRIIQGSVTPNQAVNDRFGIK